MTRQMLLPALVLAAACAAPTTPTQPSTVPVAVAPVTIALEGEAGSGDGSARDRSRASGGRTIHLGPGEHRVWTFKSPGTSTAYAVSVTYANGKEGENEVLEFRLDGALISSFRNRDSGDAIEGWNLFVTDPAGRSTLGPGAHAVTVDVRGGDGCVEIDLLTLTPGGAAVDGE